MLRARRVRPSADGPAPREPECPGRPPVPASSLSFILVCALFLLCAAAARAETVVVRLVVNGEPKGDVFVERTPGGDFLVRLSDLAAAGLRETAGAAAEAGGETFIFIG